MSKVDEIDSEYAGEDQSFLAHSVSLPRRVETVHLKKARHILQSSYLKLFILQLFLVALYTAVFFTFRKENLIYCKLLSNHKQ